MKLGATGNFPQGKLNETDEGELHITIGEENGCVRINFGKPTAWIAMDPQIAFSFASKIIEKAKEIKAHEKSAQS